MFMMISLLLMIFGYVHGDIKIVRMIIYTEKLNSYDMS